MLMHRLLTFECREESGRMLRWAIRRCFYGRAGFPSLVRPMSFINSQRDQRRSPSMPPPKKDDGTLDVHVNITMKEEDKSVAPMSMPMMVYIYSPLSRLLTILALLRLKVLWDWQFSEANFVEHSMQAAAVVTDFVRRRRISNVERCTTPMGFKQLRHDLLTSSVDWRLNLMRFERQHIRRAIPLKVQLLRHYEHRFAFIDMVYIALRRSNDFYMHSERREVAHIVEQHVDRAQMTVQHPLIFAEVFMRFRRDYSVKPMEMGNVRANRRCMGQWLISAYKIVRFDLLNHHPLFNIPDAYDLRPQPNIISPLPPRTH